MASPTELSTSTDAEDSNTTLSLPAVNATENFAPAELTPLVAAQDETVATERNTVKKTQSVVTVEKGKSETVGMEASVAEKATTTAPPLYTTFLDTDLVPQQLATAFEQKAPFVDLPPIHAISDEAKVSPPKADTLEGAEHLEESATDTFSEDEAKFKFAVYLAEWIADWFDSEQKAASETNPKSLLGNGDLVRRFNLLFRMSLINSQGVTNVMNPSEGDIFLARINFHQNHNGHIKTRCYLDENQETVALGTVISTPGIGGWIEFVSGKSKGRVKKTSGYAGAVVEGIVEKGLLMTVFPERERRTEESISLERLNQTKINAEVRDNTETQSLIQGYKNMTMGASGLETISLGDTQTALYPVAYFDNSQNTVPGLLPIPPWIDRAGQMIPPGLAYGQLSSNLAYGQQQPGYGLREISNTYFMPGPITQMQPANMRLLNQGIQYGSQDHTGWQPPPGFVHQRTRGGWVGITRRGRDEQGPRPSMANNWRGSNGHENGVGGGDKPKGPRKNKNKSKNQYRNETSQDPALEVNSKAWEGWNAVDRQAL